MEFCFLLVVLLVDWLTFLNRALKTWTVSKVTRFDFEYWTSLAGRLGIINEQTQAEKMFSKNAFVHNYNYKHDFEEFFDIVWKYLSAEWQLLMWSRNTTDKVATGQTRLVTLVQVSLNGKQDGKCWITILLRLWEDFTNSKHQISGSTWFFADTNGTVFVRKLNKMKKWNVYYVS